MNIRRAEEKDILQIEELLYQVHKVHSDKRPDLFIPGSKKYTTNELKEILADDEKPVYVADNDIAQNQAITQVFILMIYVFPKTQEV